MEEALRITEEEGDVIDIFLTKEPPIAYERKIHELMDRCGLTRDEAESQLLTPIPVELFYSMDQGLFTVESDAIDSCEIYNPYTGEEIPNDNLIYK
jgi:hypothetical protein